MTPAPNRTESSWCERLAWDSEFFGIEIGCLRTPRLSGEILQFADRWCAANAIDCLYFLGEADDALSIRCAENSGFDLVDVRMTFATPISPDERMVRMPDGVSIRPVLATDLVPLKAIARNSYRDSRFYVDGRFPVEKCDLLYETWLEQNCAGLSGAVLVAECEGRPAGYVACDAADAVTGRISLIASSVPGAGLGTALVNSACGWFRQQGFDRAHVVTQGRNVAARELYQRCGFVTESVQLWFHRWFDGGRAGRSAR